MPHVRATLSALLVVTVVTADSMSRAASKSFGRPPATSSATSPAEPGDRVAPFQDGVRINWTRREVEADGQVVLRHGYLELFACSGPHKVHESIVRLHAKPSHFYRALGLIGLTPGRPARWDEQSETAVPACGEQAAVLVRWNDGNQTHVVAAHEWLLDLETERPLPPLRWLFTGSTTLRDGLFGADIDGAVICVVDFPTAVLTLVPPEPTTTSTAPAPSSKPTRDAAQTTRPAPASVSTQPDADMPIGPGESIHINMATDPAIGACTDRIPPEGTPVTVIVRPWREPPGSQPIR
ncbi:MAG: hypothetical protein HUU22_05135 [Phycisphaerae bacterium]|nr:YdjY domain-containing protein [Phycisphaerae bacterium]NUQ45397.1 hypothetical protein [Phycisphaerae bacterium]